MAGKFGLLSPNSEAGIVVWTGLPGGGKSFQAAQLQVDWLERGLPVLSNLKITALPNYLIKPRWGEFVLADDDDFKKCDEVLDEDGKPIYETFKNEKGVEQSVKKMKLRLFRKLELLRERHPGKHVLILIDEAHNFYPARGWKDNPQAVYSFLTQHRHLNCSVLAITQNEAMVDNTFRQLAQEFRHHKNLVKDSMLEMVLWWFGDNFHLAYSCANSGGKPYKQEKYGRTWFRIKKNKAALYSTSQMHSSDLRGAARQVKGRSMRLIFLVVFVAFISGIVKVLSMVLGGEDPEEQAVEAAAPESALVRLESMFQTGDVLCCVVIDPQYGERYIYRPYNDDEFWKLSERIGQDIEAPLVEAKQFGKIKFTAAKSEGTPK